MYLHLPAAHSADEIVLMTVNLVVRSRPGVGRMSFATFPEMGKSKEVTVLLPPQEDVLLGVSASSYESRPADGSEAKVLNVLPGAIEDVVVSADSKGHLIAQSALPLSQEEGRTTDLNRIPSTSGDDLNHVGGRVSAPILLSHVEAEYTEEAREAHFQGTVVIELIVDTEGNPQNPQVKRSLGMGLDQKAIEAVRKYKFKPAMLDGNTPIPVMMTVEVGFHR